MKRRQPRDIAAELDAIYAKLPTIECRGKCWDGCTNIELTGVERTRIERTHGLRIDSTNPHRDGMRVCPALTQFRQCGVYAQRPMLCRLWGLIPSMACNSGCVPEGGLMRERDGWLLMAEVHEVAGDHDMARTIRELFADERAAATEKLFLAMDDRTDPETLAMRSRMARLPNVRYVAGPGRLSRTRTEQA